MLKVKPLPWRTKIVNRMFADLDAISKKNKSPQAKRQQKARKIGEASVTNRIPEYITNVPDITQQFESTIDELQCDFPSRQETEKESPSPAYKEQTTTKKLKPSGSPVPWDIQATYVTSPADESNPKNGHSSKGKDIAKHPWRLLKLKNQKVTRKRNKDI